MKRARACRASVTHQVDRVIESLEQSDRNVSTERRQGQLIPAPPLARGARGAGGGARAARAAGRGADGEPEADAGRARDGGRVCVCGDD